VTSIEDEIEEELSTNEEPSMLKKLSSEDKVKMQKDHMALEGSLITKDEDEEIIEVGLKSYVQYFKEACFWLLILLFVFPIEQIWNVIWMVQVEFPSMWMDDLDKEDYTFSSYFWYYFHLNTANFFCVFTSLGFLSIYCVFISNRFFKRMAYKVIHAPINLFFDTTPSGWILNRFSKDIEKLDGEFYDQIFNTLDCLSTFIIIIYVCAKVSVWTLISIPLIGLSMFFLIKVYI
jgi:ATP-binding cassette, subfamily C (CFTR/MRP), member 1